MIGSFSRTIVRSRVIAAELDGFDEVLERGLPEVLPTVDFTQKIVRIRACFVELNDPLSQPPGPRKPPGLERAKGH